MKIPVVVAALLLAVPAFAQTYQGDDDDSWNQQQPPPPQPPQQGENYGYGNANEPPPPPPAEPSYIQPYSGAPQPPVYAPPQPQPVYTPPPSPAYQPTDGPTFADFESDPNLSSHGVWIDTAEYGRAWQPTPIPEGWQPYLYGRWALTDAGWAWVSDEPFGWATYHYGRWAFLDGAGWVWVPGRVWAPAWVAWRYGEGYAGWCPLGPHGVVYDQPRHWVVVEQARFLQPVRMNVVPIFNRQRIFVAPVNRGPRAGPEPVVIARVTGQEVRPLVIGDHGARHTEVNGGTISFYRPRSAPIVAPVNRVQVNTQPRPPGYFNQPQREPPPRVITEPVRPPPPVTQQRPPGTFERPMPPPRPPQVTIEPAHPQPPPEHKAVQPQPVVRPMPPAHPPVSKPENEKEREHEEKK
jgi:hypothetical protein